MTAFKTTKHQNEMRHQSAIISSPTHILTDTTQTIKPDKEAPSTV